MTLQRKPLAKIGKKPKLCEWCRESFQRVRIGEKCCSVKCAMAWAKNEQVKRDCAPYAKAKPRKRVKNKAWWTEKAKEQLHRWIVHVRDKDQPCISCGIAKQGIKYDAGHMLSVGAHKNLEMEPLNIHKQCSVNCNQHLSGNRAGYEKGLAERYDQALVDWLTGPHEDVRLRSHDYEAIRDNYRDLNHAAGVLPHQLNRG